MNNCPSSMLEPRGFAATAILMAALTGLPFALLWTFLFAMMLGRSFGSILPIGLLAGLAFGVLFGLVMAALLRDIAVTVEIRDRQRFFADLPMRMARLGYHPVAQLEGFHSYKPSFQAGLAAGRISVQVQDGRAVIVGPATYVRKLPAQLTTG